MHFTADWDYTVSIDGDGYVVVPLHRSRLRRLLAWLGRRPTHEVYPVQAHPAPTAAEIEAGAEVQRFTVPTEGHEDA